MPTQPPPSSSSSLSQQQQQQNKHSSSSSSSISAPDSNRPKRYYSMALMKQIGNDVLSVPAPLEMRRQLDRVLGNTQSGDNGRRRRFDALKVTDNGWKRSLASLDNAETPEARFLLQVRSLLNKVVLSNVDEVRRGIEDLIADCSGQTKIMNVFVKTVYEKSLREPNWLKVYVTLLHSFDSTFYIKYMIHLCEKTFNSLCTLTFPPSDNANNDGDNANNDGDNTNNNGDNNNNNNGNDENELIEKMEKDLVSIALIFAELYDLDRLGNDKVERVLERLVVEDVVDSEEARVLTARKTRAACRFAKRVGGKVCAGDLRAAFDTTYFPAFVNLSKFQHMEFRLKCEVLDVIDLYNSGWVPRKPVVTTTTTTNVHTRASSSSWKRSSGSAMNNNGNNNGYNNGNNGNNNGNNLVYSSSPRQSPVKRNIPRRNQGSISNSPHVQPQISPSTSPQIPSSTSPSISSLLTLTSSSSSSTTTSQQTQDQVQQQQQQQQQVKQVKGVKEDKEDKESLVKAKREIADTFDEFMEIHDYEEAATCIRLKVSADLAYHIVPTLLEHILLASSAGPRKAAAAGTGLLAHFHAAGILGDADVVKGVTHFVENSVEDILLDAPLTFTVLPVLLGEVICDRPALLSAVLGVFKRCCMGKHYYTKLIPSFLSETILFRANKNMEKEKEKEKSENNKSENNKSENDKNKEINCNVSRSESAFGVLAAVDLSLGELVYPSREAGVEDGLANLRGLLEDLRIEELFAVTADEELYEELFARVSDRGDVVGWLAEHEEAVAKDLETLVELVLAILAVKDFKKEDWEDVFKYYVVHGLNYHVVQQAVITSSSSSSSDIVKYLGDINFITKA